MATLTSALSTRLLALLDGSYTAGGRYVTGVTFTAASSATFLPQENPEWPDVVTDRTFDVVWQALGFDPPGAENTFQGPHISTVRATVRVQYQAETAEALSPRENALVLGTLQAATRKALDDAAVLRWIFQHTPVWSDVAIGCTVGEATTELADRLRVVSSIPLTWLVSTAAETAPGWT